MVVNDLLRNSLRMQNHIHGDGYLRVTSAAGSMRKQGSEQTPGALQLSYPLSYSIHRVLFNPFNLIVGTDLCVTLMQFDAVKRVWRFKKILKLKFLRIVKFLELTPRN